MQKVSNVYRDSNGDEFWYVTNSIIEHSNGYFIDSETNIQANSYEELVEKIKAFDIEFEGHCKQMETKIKVIQESDWLTIITGPAGSGKTRKAIQDYLTCDTVLVNNEECYAVLGYIAGDSKGKEFNKAVVMTDEIGTEQGHFISTALQRGKRNGCTNIIYDCNRRLTQGVLDRLHEVFKTVVVTVLCSIDS